MTMFDEAQAIAGMISMKKITQCEAARLLGTSQAYIANKLRLLKFSENAKKAILSARLSERHARALLRVSEDELFDFIEKIKEGSLSVALTEAMIDAHCDKRAHAALECCGGESGILRFEELLLRSVRALKGNGVDVRLMTNYIGPTKYITLAIKCDFTIAKA